MKIRQVIIALALVLTGGAITPSLVYAEGCGTAESCARSGVDQVSSSGTSMTVGGIIKIIVDILLFVLGAVCVVMIVIGGIKYTTSQGDQTAVSSAKNFIPHRYYTQMTYSIHNLFLIKSTILRYFFVLNKFIA